VTSYRLYRFGPRDRLLPPEVVLAKDDREAVDGAARLLEPGQAGEVWQGARMVGSFSKLGVFTPMA